MSSDSDWLVASPLWAASQTNRQMLVSPALLRFRTDQFMETLLADVQSQDPTTIAAHLVADPKLFQPVHGEFNLVAASLVCRRRGLPDRDVNPAADKVGFVMRRLVPRTQQGGDGDTYAEYAWATPPTANLPEAAPAEAAPPKTTAAWSEVSDLSALAAGEELLPLFPINFRLAGRARRIYAGLIPVASRDTFAAGPLSTLPADSTFHPLEDAIDARIVGQMKALRSGANITKAAAIEASLFILLDLAGFLQEHIPATWAAIQAGSAPNALTPLNQVLLAKADGTVALYVAVKEVDSQRAAILAGGPLPGTLAYDLRNAAFSPDELRSALVGALPDGTNVYVPPSGLNATPQAKLANDPGAQYVIRCVYIRNCHPAPEVAVSLPSRAFALAGFFEPGAPARTIRIAMPVDTSPAGLRKFNNNVGFLLSDQLRSQIERVTDAKEALKGNMGNDPGFALGAICSFSLPIITICAMIVLMIFINLLNIVFWWLPLLRICFPIPLKAKGGS